MPNAQLMTQIPRTRAASGLFWITLIVLGILFRIAIVLTAGNQLRAPWSGGGDAPHYVLLAQNLLAGRGYTYALQPTALRPPGYPLLLAALVWMFGSKFVIAVRLVQFVLGLATAYLCSRTAALLFDETAARPALAVALIMPTLVFITGEVLTEAIGAFLAALFFYLAALAIRNPRMTLFVALGVVTSLAALFRFNMALFGIAAMWIASVAKNPHPVWQRVLLVCASAGLVISPWLIRNHLAFHGQALYSTLSGHDAVEGVVAPQGRALPGDEDRIRAAEGWTLGDIETNARSRLNFPSESVLNSKAWAAAEHLWKQYGSRLLPIMASKISCFWLSTDQIFWTESFSWPQRIFRWGGVLAYWVVLAIAVAGCLSLRRSAPVFAGFFLFYVLLVTAMHLLFPMITRLRIPFVDPLLATFAGGALRARMVSPGPTEG